MPPDLDQLVRAVVELTGVPAPAWIEDDAPVLSDRGAELGYYLVGLIGGKDVGKSALVNALVGHEITARTSHGPGTETVIAYAHESNAAGLRELLEREVPGQFTIVPHALAHLKRQVLLDLPDVDSHWSDHFTVTRKMLRHLLFPVWVQSVEKYADRQPQELLARVAAGNAPANFVFCLNKVDQVANVGSAIQELQEDYAQRLQRVLALPAPPRVWAIAAIRPGEFDLPAVRELLTQQKSEDSVRESLAKAALRQKSSVLTWLDQQDLPARAARIARLQEDAESTVNDRLGGPLLDGVLPKLLDEPMHRQAILDECLGRRAARWPIVNVLHAVFAGIGGLFRRNTEAVARPLGPMTGEALVDPQLRAMSAVSTPDSPGRSLSDRVQTTFALLQQSSPQFSELYADRKLWEPMPASVAAGELRQSMIATVDRQRTVACEKLNEPGGTWASLARGLLTVGALIWFPFAQPIVSALLARRIAASQPSAIQTPDSLSLLLVNLLSINYLLGTVTFLLIYFSVLWLVIRWDTQRRVNSHFARWKRLENMDPELSLAGRVVAWLDGLLEPLRKRRGELDDLSSRVEGLRRSVTQ